MKQVLISMVVVMLAAGIFVGVVLHTVSFMRQMQLQIMTGEILAAEELGEDNTVAVYRE